MARRPGDDGPILDLSPRALRIGGWVVAFLLIAAIAIVVGLLGGDAESGPIGSSPSASDGTATVAIVFGTSIDQAAGEVPEEARTDRFAAGDTFAYSVSMTGAAPDPVYVEVRRTGGGALETVQTPAQGEQELEFPPALAFDVPADNLFAAFGPGDYLMLIYPALESEPLAEGTFQLVGPAESGDPATSISPPQ